MPDSADDEVPMVVIVLPPEAETDSIQNRKWKELEKASTELGWSSEVIRAKPVRSQRIGESGRPLAVLDPWDALKIYKDAHRRPLAVVQFKRTMVLVNPKKHPSSANAIPLERFSRHKVYFDRLPAARNDREVAREISDVVDGFIAWLATCECDGDRDPRCLPLHEISPTRDWEDLNTVAGRESFEDIHGKPSALRDSDNRHWQRANARHGRETLVVAQRPLPQGFHWDVYNESAPTSLAAINEVWWFPKRSYVNIYPDGQIRQGQSSGTSAVLQYRSERPNRRILESMDVRVSSSAPKRGRSRSRGSKKR